MLFLAICLTYAVALQVANTASIPNDKIEPVNLSYFCFHTQTAGKEHNKSAIVLVHGFGDSAHTWDGVWEVLALKTGRRICAVDLRNHGGSPWNDRGDVEAMAVDIGHFLDSQKIHKVNLIGHSLGGKVSIHYALKNAQRVNSIVVEDMTVNTLPQGGAKADLLVIQLLQDAIKSVPEGSTEDEAKEAVVDYIIARNKELGLDNETDKRTTRGLDIRCTNGKCQFRWNIDLYEKILERSEDWWTISSGFYDGPALFIYGTQSIFDVNGDRKNIMNVFPNAKLIGVEGAGHEIHYNCREFNDEVIKFLNGLKD